MTIMSERRTSLIGGLLVAVGPFSMAIYTPAMPTLVTAFGTSEAIVKLSLSIYFAGFAFAQLVCGPMSDGFGRRRVTVWFMGLYMAGSILAALAPNIETLLVARLVQGVGASVGVATARAIVRDQFTGDTSSRILNTIGIVLALGPAVAPSIGGLTLHLADWHAIFLVMIAFGAGVVCVCLVAMRETARPDPALLRPDRLATSYARLLRSRRFLCSSIVVAGSVGTLYTLATVLPFVLIGVAGLTPAQYGIGMLGQSGLFFLGSVAARLLMPRIGAAPLVPAGLGFIAAGSLLLIASIAFVPVSYPSIMLPVGLYAFGIAFVMPAMTTTSLAPFPDIAGSAAAMMGFIQMGAGLVGGVVCALIGHPVLATQIVIPTLGATAIVAYVILRRDDTRGRASAAG